MPDILQVLYRYWKTIFLLTAIATAIAAILVFLQPKQYLSVATALPASSVASDKAGVFNDNIHYLYSSLGNADDLNRIIGTAQLDTLYVAVAKENNLIKHYEIEADKNPDRAAAKELKSNSDIIKSEYGELKIKVWDEDRKVAAQLANALLQKLQQIHQHLQGLSNALIVKNIKQDHNNLQQQFRQVSDSLGKTNEAAIKDILAAKRDAQLEQLQQYEKLLAEYQLMIRTNPPVLLVVENAVAGVSPDRPKRLQTVLMVMFAAAAFSFLLMLFIEGRKQAL